MNIEQIYTKCLAQGAYFIASNGEAAVIDPLRDPAPYLQRAKDMGVTIKYVMETHFHADFVSGHHALAEASGATIVFGPTANPNFPCKVAEDGEILPLGDISFKVTHTPGHTMESTCYILRDADDKDHALFSGDTLFLGDVGRPDLAQKAADTTMEQLAGILFDSLREKIMTLEPEVIVYPGHGAGSACGKNMSKETVGTLGEQLESNYALRSDMTKEEFVVELIDGIAAPPQYFGMNVGMNKSAIDGFASVALNANNALNPEAVLEHKDALILDGRDPQVFAGQHVPGSMNIGLDGQFAPWVGALVPMDKVLILIAPEGRETEMIMRLARVGFDNVLGYLHGGLKAWTKAKMPTDKIQRITADVLESNYADSKAQILDVRALGEYQAEHILDVNSLPLDAISTRIKELPKATAKKPLIIHCAGGYRSMVFASIIKANGHHHIMDVIGGFNAIKEMKGVPMSAYNCPSGSGGDNGINV